jgi:hypothetical protein
VRDVANSADKTPQQASLEVKEAPPSKILELARQVLYLEQQLEAYQSLYDEDLAQIRSALSDCRRKLLALLSAGEGK